MLKLIRYSSLLLLSGLFLVGCESTMFGMPESQFQSLSPSQKQQVIHAYNQRESERQAAENERSIIDAQNAPLNNLIGVANNAVSRINAQENGQQDNQLAPAASSMPAMSSHNFKPEECKNDNGWVRCHRETHS